MIETKPGNLLMVLDSIDERHSTRVLAFTVKLGNESVCSKTAAKRPHVVQKELTSFFGFSQSGSRKAKGMF